MAIALLMTIGLFSRRLVRKHHEDIGVIFVVLLMIPIALEIGYKIIMELWEWSVTESS